MTGILKPKHPYKQNKLNNLDFCECGVAKNFHDNQTHMKYKQDTIKEVRIQITDQDCTYSFPIKCPKVLLWLLYKLEKHT